MYDSLIDEQTLLILEVLFRLVMSYLSGYRSYFVWFLGVHELLLCWWWRQRSVKRRVGRVGVGVGGELQL